MRIVKLFVLLVLLPLTASAQVDPGETDTLRIGTVSCLPGRQCDVPVYFFNDEKLIGLEVVMSYDTNYLVIDSFSLIGGRLENFEDPLISYFQYKDDLLNFAFTPNYYFNNDTIQPGNGLMGTLHFTVMPVAGGISTPIVDAIWPMVQGQFRSTIFAKSATEGIVPLVVPGEVTIQDAPPSADSIWVDTITGVAGQTVAVNVFGYNEEDLAAINIALEVSSDNLIYNSTIYTGTRSESAFTKQVSRNDRELLINLVFSEAAPLEPGSGSLVRILFDIFSEATEETVIIDTVTYAGVQPTQFVLTDDGGSLAFTPYFRPGHVEIKRPTAVDDMEADILPTQFALGQNVPNPFNPVTRISFDLPQASEVQLTIYNILGQEVRTLVDTYLPAGTHEVIFDGRGEQSQTLASGVYFYRINAGDFRQSKKMALMK